MIRTDSTISTSVRVNGIQPPRLIVKLKSENEDWTMHGELSFTGLGPKSMDRIEDELVRRLHGRCTLSVSSVHSYDIMTTDDLSRSLDAFCRDWGLSIEEMAKKSGLNQVTIRKCLSGGGKVRQHTRHALSSTIDRIDQHPTVGEYLRRRRLKVGYHSKQAARFLDVSEDVLIEWERDEGVVPDNKKWCLMNMYGITDDIWSIRTPTVLNIMAPATATSPQPWGTYTEESPDGEEDKEASIDE